MPKLQGKNRLGNFDQCDEAKEARINFCFLFFYQDQRD
jgi:hypothetical protein